MITKPARESSPPRTSPRTQWRVVDRATGQSRAVAPDEWFPVAGRLVSGVWELDDGRLLLATSADDARER